MKLFTIRNVDPKIHQKWKAMAGYLGQTMEEFASVAIDEYVKTIEVRFAKEVLSKNEGNTDEQTI